MPLAALAGLAQQHAPPVSHCSEACALCTLRLRLCYGKEECALCKLHLDAVVVTPWRPDLPDWQFFLDHPDCVARSGKFAKGRIWADRCAPPQHAACLCLCCAAPPSLFHLPTWFCVAAMQVVPRRPPEQPPPA